MATAEIRYQVGEAWKGTYNASTEYSLAAVVKDPQGMSVYRSLRSGNVGHPVTDTNWWFCIIDMSSIKNLNDNIIQNESNRVSAETTRQTNENNRVSAEEERVRQANADHLLSEEINTHPMRINTTTGTWERWDTDNDQYVDTGVMAMASPFATFDVDVTTGCIIMTFDATYTGPQFSLDQNTGNLLLTI